MTAHHRPPRHRARAAAALALAAALTLAACGSGDPLAGDPTDGPTDRAGTTLVVGSQDYYSNEIIAEIYAQALEADGYTIDRQFRIGQREVYLPEIEAGSIDLFPEYTGPLLQYWVPGPAERKADEVYDALVAATPEGLRVLEQSDATDQDTYAVTRAFATEWNLQGIADLSRVTVPMTMGANSEAENRPNGPEGLAAVYGVQVAFTPIEDGGGPLTVKALQDNAIQLAIIYTADPTVVNNDLVLLQDTKGLFLASHVVPVASANVDAQAEAIIDGISEAMSAQDLLTLNARSVNEQLPAATIAADWLADKGLG